MQSAVGLQLEQIAAAGNAAEKSLLADVLEKTPDASYVELLRLFKVRRSVLDLDGDFSRGRCICACCIVSAAHCPHTSARSCRT